MIFLINPYFFDILDLELSQFKCYSIFTQKSFLKTFQ
jgi:hypothetical protein